MPVCLTHNQRYDTSAGEHCIYCGQPAPGAARLVQHGDTWGYELHRAAAAAATDGLPMSEYRLVTCERCGVPVPSHAVHRCNAETVVLPEIKDEDIPPHERL